MKVFLYEHITVTCDSRDPLYAEGAAMRDALRTDMDAIADVEVLDGDFDICASIADWTILIAPETGGILQALAERVLLLGGRLLGPSPEAIRLASDKLALAECWEKSGVRTPQTRLVGPKRAFDLQADKSSNGHTLGFDCNPPSRHEARRPPPSGERQGVFGDGKSSLPATPNLPPLGGGRQMPRSGMAGGGIVRQYNNNETESLTVKSNALVIKPRDGAGSERMALIRNSDEYDAFLQQHHECMIVQPFIPGIPASVAFLVGPNQLVPLQPTLQRLSEDFHYFGGELPLPSDLAERAVRLGRAALEAARTGWLGYVGVDMILGDEGDFAIEINPRLTTSYVGLRTATKVNLADAMVRIAEGLLVPEIVWKPGRKRWNAR